MLQNNSGRPLIRMAVKAVLTGSTAVAWLGAAEAQEAPAPAASESNEAAPAEVVVTGSRLVIPNSVSISPVTTVTSDTIQQTGTVKVEDLLNQLPQVTAAQSSSVVNGADGTAQVNLRNLQPKRTLVLVDGLRLGPGDPRFGGASDINMIPEALLEGVDILTGGASSTYGADAVAGVVNFKLNDHYEGVKLVASGSFYDHTNSNTGGVISDLQAFNTANNQNYAQAPGHVDTGPATQLSFIAGVNSGDGKGNATFYATYRNVQPVLQNDYAISECSLASGYATSGPYGRPKGSYQCVGSSTAYPGRFIYTNPTTGVQSDSTLNAQGGLIPYTNAAAYNFGPLNYFIRPDENYTAGAFLHYTFNDHVTVYANSMFMDDLTVAQIAPSGAFLQSFAVNCDNPFLTSSELSTWCGGAATPGTNANLLIGRRSIEGGNRQDNLEHTDFREVIGAKGAIDKTWTYDASVQFSQVNLEETYLNDVSINKINYALDAVNTSTGPQCAITVQDQALGVSPTGPAANCVPWNLFTPNKVTPAQAAYLDTPGFQRGQVRQYVVNVNFSGDLGNYGLKLPGANTGVLVNVGGEYRDVADYNNTDIEFSTGDLAGQGGASPSVRGSIVSREGFMETHVPILDDQFLAKSLSFDGGYRYSGYETSGSGFQTNTYKAGLEWAPSSDYRLRASFERAVRAPNVAELFGADTIALDGTTDLCAGKQPAATKAQCAALGVPNSAYGKVLPNPAAQYNGLLGGNTQLQPETAITKSFGLGWTPSYVPNLYVQIDYFDIGISGVIKGIGESTIENLCTGQGLDCDLVHRSPAPDYSLWLNNGYITDTLQNIGKLETKGVDFEAHYSLPLDGFGKLNALLDGTYTTAFDTTPISALPSTEYNCEGYYGNTCGLPTFKWRHTLRLDWLTPWHGLSFGLAWRYFSPVDADYLNPKILVGGAAQIATGMESITDAHIASFSYLDLNADWRVNDYVSLRVGVNNLFDKDPPIIGATNVGVGVLGGNGNTFPQVYDAMGRQFFATATVQF